MDEPIPDDDRRRRIQIRAALLTYLNDPRTRKRIRDLVAEHDHAEWLWEEEALEVYRVVLRRVLADGIITEAERGKLVEVERKLELDLTVADALEAEILQELQLLGFEPAEASTALPAIIEPTVDVPGRAPSKLGDLARSLANRMSDSPGALGRATDALRRAAPLAAKALPFARAAVPGIAAVSVLAVIAAAALAASREASKAGKAVRTERQPIGKGQVIRTRLVGVSRENPDGRRRQEIILSECVPGGRLCLRREPGNLADAHAIAVDTDRGSQLGYLDRILAADLAQYLDAGGDATAKILTIVGGGDCYLGVNAAIECV